MRVPRIPALLLTATCFLSGCAALNGTFPSGRVCDDQCGGVVPKGSVSQKGAVVSQGHVHPPGHVHQKGVVQKGVVQKGVMQKGVMQKGVMQKGAFQKGGVQVCAPSMHSQYKAAMHQNLWNQFEPSGCCGDWDPVLGSCQACGVCGGSCQGRTPAQHMKHMLTCSSGCGEVYWGDWLSHPPADCDPCDDWGNYTGPAGCGPSCLETLASGWGSLFGFRHGGGKGGCASCGGKGGCDTCGGQSAEYYDMPLEFEGNHDSSGAGEANGDAEIVPTPEMEAGDQNRLLPRATSGFRIRSARLTR